MNQINCRYSSCAMYFKNIYSRDSHEGLMHKTLMEDSARILLNAIMRNNKKENLNKKVLKTPEGNMYSYNEVNILFDEDTEEAQEIRKVLKNTAQSIYNTHEDYNMNSLANLQIHIS